ncbi:MAG: type II toxin-antitoxin system HipA family toxin [Coriobacteriia bacterium]|nr:type II toxin-antitoxin system HipA family toxin [Coriobacteriia bacterium]
MHQTVESLKVYCWGRYVGALALDQRTGYYAFEYNPDFQTSGIELAPLALPLSDLGPQIFSHLPEKTYYRLPPFIADSLPDNFGNSIINAYMANRGIASSDLSPLDRLAYIGSRGMGALEFVPALQRQNGSALASLDMGELVSEARRAVRANLNRDSTLDAESELAQLIQIGVSAGGARAKAVVGFDKRSEEFVSGQLDVPEGFEHWIIKFDVESSEPGNLGVSQEYGRIEYAYYLMASDCGIQMEESRLYEAAGRTHFMTKRFDREMSAGENIRHHMQTLCALSQLDFNQRGTHDYSQLFMAAYELGLPLYAYDEIFLRMVLNVACSNKDDHTKNHSFRLKQGEAWELSPAYDITYAFGSNWTAQHLMGVGGQFIDISREDVLALAQRYYVRSPETLLDVVLDVADNWSEYAGKAGLKTDEKDRIGKVIKHCSMLLR